MNKLLEMNKSKFMKKNCYTFTLHKKISHNERIESQRNGC